MTKKIQRECLENLAQPSLESLMYPEAWALLEQLSHTSVVRTTSMRTSRAASTLYSLGFTTSPDRRAWNVTDAGREALVGRGSIDPTHAIEAQVLEVMENGSPLRTLAPRDVDYVVGLFNQDEAYERLADTLDDAGARDVVERVVSAIRAELSKAVRR